MGSAASKSAPKPRKFPSAKSPSVAQRRPQRPSASEVEANTSPSSPKQSGPGDLTTNSATDTFAKRLHQMGIVNPAPQFSRSSTAYTKSRPNEPGGIGLFYPPANSPTLASLDARKHLQAKADAELMGSSARGTTGREFLDVATVTCVLLLREKGHSSSDIESSLRLKPGVVDRLGRRQVFSPLTES